MCCSIFYHLLGYKTIDILLSWQMVNFAMFTKCAVKLMILGMGI